MRVFKHTYTRNGKTCETANYYAEFRDHLETLRRVPLFHDLRSSEEAAKQIENLVALRSSGAAPDLSMTRWLSAINPDLRQSLARIGVIDAGRLEAAKPLRQHLADWQAFLQSKGSNPAHVRQQASRVEAILTTCKFIFTADLNPAKVRCALAAFRDGVEGISAQTSNYYLQAIRGFSKWLCREGRMPSDPLSCLAPLSKKAVQKDLRVKRRAYTALEIAQLLNVTPTQPERYGMTGAERALIYRLAVETGLRSGEIASLTVKDFNLEAGTVELHGSNTKNGKKTCLPLRSGLVALLRVHFQNKFPAVHAFNMPGTSRVVDMIRSDLDAAGVDYTENAAGETADFHSLRHTFITLLANSGVHPKVAQDLARHSDINLTLSRYSHTVMEQRSEAVAKLPVWQVEAVDAAGVADGTTGQALTCETVTTGAGAGETVRGEFRGQNTKQNTKQGGTENHNTLQENGLSEAAKRISNPQVVGSSPAGGAILIGETVQPSLAKSIEKSAKTPSTTPSTTDPDLESILADWPDLPKHIKAAIVALVRSSKKN